MKKLLLLTAALVAFSATAAMASGLNLGFSVCTFGTAASNTYNNPCDGAGNPAKKLQGSFKANNGITDFAATDAIVDFTFSGPVPPAWLFDTGGCSDGAVTMANPTASGACATQLFGASVSSGGFATSSGGPNTLRVRVLYATGASVPPTVVAGQLYGGFALQIDPDFAFNAGCAGCADPATVTLQSLLCEGFGTGEVESITAQDQQRCVGINSPGNVCGATPTQNSTWGAVKALYR